MLAAMQLLVPDSLRTSRGDLFVLRGDTLSLERPALAKSRSLRLVFLVRGDSVVQIAPTAKGPLSPELRKALLVAANDLREGRKYRR